MGSAILLTVILAFVGGVWYLGRMFRKYGRPQQESGRDDMAKQFVEGLAKRGYFRYADPADEDQLWREMYGWYDSESTLTTIPDDETGQPLDYRLYVCDGEDLFDTDGVLNLLKELRPSFDRMNFRCEIGSCELSHIAESDDTDMSLSINGTCYVIRKRCGGANCFETSMRLGQILNAELAKQDVAERVYLINGGSEGMLVFLTPELQEYILPFYSNPAWTPLEPGEWGQVMGLEEAAVDARNVLV